MNTLPRAVTARLFNSPTDFHALRRHWSALVNSDRRHNLTAAHHVLYLALIGRDWRKGFSPVTNQRKLDNGAFYNWGLFRALAKLHSHEFQPALLAPFDGLVGDAMLQAIRGMIPIAGLHRFGADAFANGNFPFDAYAIPPIEAATHA